MYTIPFQGPGLAGGGFDQTELKVCIGTHSQSNELSDLYLRSGNHPSEERQILLYILQPQSYQSSTPLFFELINHVVSVV